MSLSESLEKLNNLDLNDLDFERIGSWPLSGRIFIWLVTIVLIVFAGYYFQVKSLNESLNQDKAKEATLRKTFEKKAFEAANLDHYRQQMEEIKIAFGAMLSQLPKDSEVPGLLEDITERGASAGLNIKSIQLQQEVSREFYVELPISVRVIGSYHQLGTFVSGVAGLPRIVTLHDYTIKKLKDGMLEMNIEAKTYRYKPNIGQS